MKIPSHYRVHVLGKTMYQNSRLWKRTLADQGPNDPQKEVRARLRLAFEQTRANVVPLVQKVGAQLPELTVHDVTHLDALWGVADTILGDEYPINPAESFVLGVAFLLHDAATSTFAYPNGLEGLKETVQWRDYVSQMGFKDESLHPGTSEFQRTLFETLRALHPLQAAKLLGQSWPGLGGESRRLMSDTLLADHYGESIGQIAASHGKDAAIVERTWASFIPLRPPAPLASELDGNEWNVDQFKVGMILRCVDAAHIDSLRAPDFLAALNSPAGESRNHWLFQGRLSAAGITEKGELFWNAGQAFSANESAAWWRCFETIQMIDQELRQADQLLANNNRSRFAARCVFGANNAIEFTKCVPVDGWTPIDVRYKVTRVANAIQNFGGAKLYGDKPYLALREIIQNAVDAVHARRVSRNKPVLGNVEVRLESSGQDHWLHVTDSGIGMSRFVVTEVLLDFGRSLWGDPQVRQEVAGLSSKGFIPIGKYGIGFFSAFMLGDEIEVTTWRDGDAEGDQLTLRIPNGPTSRPVVVDTPESDRLAEYGTRVSIRLRHGLETLLPRIGGENGFAEKPQRLATLAEVVGVVAPAADVDIYVGEISEPPQLCISKGDWKTLSAEELLKRIAPQYSRETLSRIAKTLQPVYDAENNLIGRLGWGATYISGFGYDWGVTVYQGLITGRLRLPGIMLSANSEDLARVGAHPLGDEIAFSKFARVMRGKLERIGQTDSDRLLSLGDSLEHLPLAEIDGREVTSVEITAFAANEFSAGKDVIVTKDSARCPSDLAERDFEDDFKFRPGVIVAPYFLYHREDFGLEGWIHEIIPEDEEHPRSVMAAIHYAIRQAANNVDVQATRAIVADSCGREIDVLCWTFSPIG